MYCQNDVTGVAVKNLTNEPVVATMTLVISRKPVKITKNFFRILIPTFSPKILNNGIARVYTVTTQDPTS